MMTFYIDKDYSEEDVWISYIEFSRNTSRITKQVIPQKVRIIIRKDLYKNYCYMVIACDINSGRSIYCCSVESAYNTENLEFIRVNVLFENKEEAIEYWNSGVQNQVDKVTKFYEDKIDYLNKKFKKL